MDTIILQAHFDGKQIRLDEAYELEPNTKLLVTVLPKEHSDSEQEEWLGISRNALETAYAGDEIQYSLDLIKEANPHYERR